MTHCTKFIALLTIGLGISAFADTGLAQSPTPATNIAPASTPSPARISHHYPGEEMIDVGGRRIQIVRRGQGGPTVVFETGLGGSIPIWLSFVSAVSKYTSTVCYARAGYSESDPVPGPITTVGVADELHTMLERAGFKPPYVLVGHSLGAVYVRVFAMKYPAEVGGLVLIDGSPERYMVEGKAIDPEGMALALKQFDDAKAAGFPGMHLPPTAIAETELMYRMDATGDLGFQGTLPDVPMVLISSLQPDKPGAQAAKLVQLKRELHSEIFQSTTYGMHIVTRKSGHMIPKEDPDLVLNAIQWVVDAVRAAK